MSQSYQNSPVPQGCVKCPLSLGVFFEKQTPWGSQKYQVVLQIHAPFLKIWVQMTCLPLGASGAKWRTQQNEHLVILNTSGEVPVKIVERVRGHFTYTGRGSGPTVKEELAAAAYQSFFWYDTDHIFVQCILLRFFIVKQVSYQKRISWAHSMTVTKIFRHVVGRNSSILI